MEESKRFYDVIYKPFYTQYHDVWIKVKNQDFLIRVPSITDKTEKYLLKLASVKITNYIKRPNRSPLKEGFCKVGRPRKYQYTTENEAQHYYNQAFQSKKRLLRACA
jgi:hypothetical protein